MTLAIATAREYDGVTTYVKPLLTGTYCHGQSQYKYTQLALYFLTLLRFSVFPHFLFAKYQATGSSVMPRTIPNMFVVCGNAIVISQGFALDTSLLFRTPGYDGSHL